MIWRVFWKYLTSKKTASNRSSITPITNFVPSQIITFIMTTITIMMMIITKIWLSHLNQRHLKFLNRLNLKLKFIVTGHRQEIHQEVQGTN